MAAGAAFDYTPLLEGADNLSDFLFRNDIVGSMIACQRARIHPDTVRRREITSEHYQEHPVVTQREKIDKLTFIATYCIRNGVTHRADDRSFATTYDAEGDHFFRYDPGAVVAAPPNGFWSTATALVLPIIANFDGGGGAGAPRQERPLVAKIVIIQQPAHTIINLLRSVSFGAARSTPANDFAVDVITLRHIQTAFDTIPQNEHRLGFSRLYAYGVRDMGPNMSIGSIVMSRISGRSIREVCRGIPMHDRARIEQVGRILAYTIPDMSGLPDWQARGRPEYGYFGLLHNDLHGNNFTIDVAENRANLIDFGRVVFIQRGDTRPGRGITTLDPRDPCDEAIIQFSIIRDYIMMFLFANEIEPLNEPPTTSLSAVIRSALLASRNIMFHRIERFLTVNVRELFDDFHLMRDMLVTAQTNLRVIQTFINSAHTGVVDRNAYNAARHAIVFCEAYARHHIEAFHRYRRHHPRGGGGGGGVTAYRDRVASSSYREPERRERERSRSRSPTSARRRSPERR